MNAADRYDSLIAYYAALNGRDPRQVKRQIRQESAFNPAAISRVGALGLLQFMPATWAEWGRAGTTARDPEAAIDAGCRYMQRLESRYGDLGKALAAYNWGLGHVDRIRDQDNWLTFCPDETRGYVTRCLDFAGEVVG